MQPKYLTSSRTFDKVLAVVLICTVLVQCDALTDQAGEEEKFPVFRILDVNVKPLEREGNDSFYSDTLRNQYVFMVHVESEETGSRPMSQSTDSKTDSDNIFGSGKGDQFPGFIENPTTEDFAAIVFDQPIEYLTNSIEAGTNLLEIEQIMNSSHLLFNPHLTPYAIHNVRFDGDAFHFERGDYEIAFQWGNEAGELFRDTVRVYME